VDRAIQNAVEYGSSRLLIGQATRRQRGLRAHDIAACVVIGRPCTCEVDLRALDPAAKGGSRAAGGRHDPAAALTLLICTLESLDLVFFGHQIETEVCPLAHLCDLLVDEKLQIVVLFIFEVIRESLDFLLELLVGFLGVADLLAEKLTLFSELFLSCELARESVVQEGHDKVADFFDVIDEHHVAKLLFHVVIAATLREVLHLESFNT